VGFDDVNEGERAASLADQHTPDALELLEALGTHDELRGAVDQLPERERMIVSKHYFEGVRLKDIGALLGVSEPRISQLHSRAIGRLRGLLAEAA
jgi:RNA polymerase sigma factor for flagellar operon FliA